MKTIEEWKDWWMTSKTTDTLDDFIEGIQSDAFHSGQLAGLQMGKETAMKTINEVFSKPAEKV